MSRFRETYEYSEVENKIIVSLNEEALNDLLDTLEFKEQDFDHSDFCTPKDISEIKMRSDTLLIEYLQINSLPIQPDYILLFQCAAPALIITFDTKGLHIYRDKLKQLTKENRHVNLSLNYQDATELTDIRTARGYENCKVVEQVEIFLLEN